MIDARIKRWVGSVAAGALALSGVSLTLAGTAAAEAAPSGSATEVTQSDIRPDETTYAGWHEGYTNSSPAYRVGWDGLHLGYNAPSQIINGLVNATEPGIATTATELGDLITGSNIAIASGDVHAQVAVTVGTNWATLRPAAPATKTTAASQLTDMWVASRTIGAVVKETPAALGKILGSLDDQGDLRYSAFGVLAMNPAVVTSLTWDGTAYTFGPAVTQIAVQTHTPVTGAQVRPNEDSYPGWHEGYTNATPAYSVAPEGLHLGDGANSQIIYGYAPADFTKNPDLRSLITSSVLDTVSGTVYRQVPLFFGASEAFTTIRPAVGAQKGAPAVALTDLWTSSKAIPLTALTPAIAANESVALGTLVDAIDAQGTVKALGFGVLAIGAAPAVVRSLSWNDVSYDFFASATQTVLLGSPSSTYGAGVEYTAQVRAGSINAVGEVEFVAGSKVLGKAVLADGKATFTVKDLPVGATSITAKFLGSASFLTSTGTAAHKVIVAPTTIVLTGVAEALVGSDVTLKATVASEVGIPTGSVQFRTYDGEFGNVAIDASGSASFTLKDIQIGQTELYAIYGGSANFGTSTTGIDVAIAFPPAVGTPVQVYIQNVYRDLFGRNVDRTGYADWTSQLNAGTSRVEVANGITYSTEYRMGLISDSYAMYLGRSADSAGMNGWLEAMGRGWTISQIQSGFLASPEYYAASGANDDAWASQLYSDVLGRAASADEISYWVGRIDAGVPRDRVAMGFLLSTEHLNKVVGDHYAVLLGRSLDAAGQSTWVGILQGGGRDEAIIAGIVASDEYFAELN